MRTHFMDFERDDETEVTVEYTITDYDPGVCSGPAEFCYPPEGGEVEIVKVISEKGPVDWTDEEDERWSQYIAEHHDFSGFDDDYADFLRDERMEERV